MSTSSASLPDPQGLVARLADRARDAAGQLEFTTFLVGVRARRLAKTSSEAALLAWKSAIKRGVGLALGGGWPHRDVAFDRPEVTFVWDADEDEVELLIRPVLLYGRYVKRSRALPQTRAHWPCPVCRERPRPRGCEACAFTGRQHPVSLEDLVVGPCARAHGGAPRESHLHGMGREDVDVRCLGGGRPFVVEVQAPRRRTVDLVGLAREVEAGSAGRVELPVGLRPVDDAAVARIKGWRAPKVYRAVAQATAPLDPARVEALPARLAGATLAQRTPRRVARRRTDLVRERRVLALEVVSSTSTTVELHVEAEAGTYIKELVSGDEGRTTPSITELLGAPCTCVELDVIEIRADDDLLLSSAAPGAGANTGEDEDGD